MRRGRTAAKTDGKLSFRIWLLDLLSQKEKFLVGLVSAFASSSPRPTRLRLPETGGEAAHVLRQPAVLHRRQLGLLHHLLQVGRSRPAPLQVGAACAGSSVSLDAVWQVLKGETDRWRWRRRWRGSVLYYSCLRRVGWPSFTALLHSLCFSNKFFTFLHF